ncbi:MAG: hypothetical protein H6737_24110 [Alphaproteobacteria bacterium]|nr:hypothetical protein [Alphaproteobacteria bacterium]
MSSADWHAAYEHFLDEPGAWQRHVGWARNDRVLPISTRWDYVFAVDANGVVWANLDEDLGGELDRFYPEPPAQVWVTRHRQEALLDGAKTYPWLREWAGERPFDAVDCPKCGGKGLPEPFICVCGNAGWLAPEEAVALGEDIPLPDHVRDYLLNHGRMHLDDSEREKLRLLNLGATRSKNFELLLRSGNAATVLESLLEQGEDTFFEAICRRFLREHEHELITNRCQRCNGLCRTPRARQCRWCGHNWHDVAR